MPLRRRFTISAPTLLFKAAFVLALWLTSAPALAQDIRQSSVRYEHLGIDDGLSDMSVGALLQDSLGFIWVGTSDGLNRYDGHEFTTFTYDPDDPNSLYDTTIYEIAHASDGGLWISTYSGVEHYDPRTEEFTRLLPGPGESMLPQDQYPEVLEDRNGFVWAGSTRNGLYRIDPETGTLRNYPPEPNDSTALRHRSVIELFESSDGTIWVATGEYGLHRYDPDSDAFERIPIEGPELSEYDGVTHIVEDESGGLWLAGWGLTHFDPVSGRMTVYLPVPDLPAPAPPRFDNYLSSLTWGSRGELWVGTFDTGVYRFDPSTGHFDAMPAGHDDPMDERLEDIRELMVDSSGLLWIGSEIGGLSMLDPRRDAVTRISVTGPQHLRRTVEDDQGRLWMVFDEEVVVWNPDTGSTDSIMYGAGSGGEVQSDVRALATPDATPGSVWLGTADGELIRMDEPGRIAFRASLVDDPDFGTTPILEIAEVSSYPGVLWVSTWGDGLCRLDLSNGAERCIAPEPGGLAGRARALVEDPVQAGMLWVATDGGLQQFDPASWTVVQHLRHDPSDSTSLSIDFVEVLHASRSEPGILWAGTWSGGLNRLDLETGLVTRRYTRQNSELPHNLIGSIVEDADGTVWVGTAQGLARIDPKTGDLSDFTSRAGLPRRGVMLENARDGDLLVTIFDGDVYRFDPSRLSINDVPPRVVFTDLRIGDETVRPSEDGPLAEPIAFTGEIELAFDQRDITFDYVALDFVEPEGVRYAYRMGGYEDEWHEVEDQRRATYTNLPPGDYTFRVKAANADGVWNEEGASVRVIVRPPWWRSIWAYGAYGLFLVGGVFAADRFQRRRLLRRERERAREKELEQARRLEEAHRELARSHEHLKATQAQLIEQEKLASLGSLTAGIAHEIKNPLNFVNNFAEVSSELAAELRDALDAGNSEAARTIIADLLQNTAQIAKHGKRADSIVRAMMQHARGGSTEKETVDVNEFVGEYVDLAWHGMRARDHGFNTDVEKDLDPEAGTMTIQSQEIGRVLVNLLNNAFQVLTSEKGPERGLVEVATRRTGAGVEIIVTDNGPGIPPDIRSRIFEPFFTTKSTGEGTGLGLSLSYDIVTKGHGGEMLVDDAPDGGARFTVRLPDIR